jgi:sulfate/thiosulfate transport system permease protein
VASRSAAVGNSSTVAKWVFRVLVVAYLFMLVVWPTAYVVKHTFADGFTGIQEALNDPAVIHALKLTVQVAVISVLINTVFGVGMSLLLVRHTFIGKRALSVLIDLPLSVSPVVVGLALVLVYNGRFGWFGPWLEDHGMQIIFARPAMVMATCFVILPLVIREIVPVLEELGDDQEQAARSLGANARQTFWRITLPGIKWAVVFGVVLSLARALGEFGAIKVVAGNVGSETVVATVLVQQKYQNFQQETAYSVSFMLVFAAVMCLVVVALLRPKENKR